MSSESSSGVLCVSCCAVPHIVSARLLWCLSGVAPDQEPQVPHHLHYTKQTPVGWLVVFFFVGVLCDLREFISSSFRVRVGRFGSVVVPCGARVVGSVTTTIISLRSYLNDVLVVFRGICFVCQE